MKPATISALLPAIRGVQNLAIKEAAMTASCLSTLGGLSHEEAYGMLAAMAERATRQGRAGRVA